jgi:hypothetical protein
MSATTAATITTFEMELLGENFIAFGRQIIVFAFD